MSTKTIQILGEKYEISAPYVAGHALSEAEAKVLNQTRGENIGNNFRKSVKDALALADETARSAALTKILEEITAYDKEYVFTVSGTHQVVDPVEREALKLAKAAVMAKLKADGRDIKAIDKEKLEAAIEKVALREDILKAAKKRVSELKKSTETSLEDLGI